MIQAHELPAASLLQRYRKAGAYTDCYAAGLDFAVSQVEYIRAFYCTWLFRLERWVLAVAVRRPSSDAQASALANGTLDTFAAWTVEARADNQLLLCDFLGRTRSWLMCEIHGDTTRLYFGSAVVPRPDASGRQRMGIVFAALLGFHKTYSRLLLSAARQRLRRAYRKTVA
jgi:hypothetical protein